MKRIYFILLLAVVGFSVYAQEENKDVRAGNKLYNKENFAQAETEYRKALEKKPQSFEANFNLGNALYRQQKYDEALKCYTNASALSQDNKKKLAAGLHNLGNSYLLNKKFEESIQAYKTALKNNPSDNETRYNLAVAQKMLKKQQQNPEDEDDKDDKEKQQDQDQKPDENNEKEQEQEQNQQQNQQEQPKMSKENAQQILNALMEEEKDTQEKVKKQNVRSSKKAEKDW